jgi:hypothetical protein
MGRTGATYGVVTPNKMLATAYDTGSPDVAEFYLDAVGDLEPGDVVVFDPGGGLRLMRSVRAYDTAVAGVISTEPGITLAVRDGEIIAGDNEGEVPLALIGRVPCKASAENGPIAVGDLLTTSSTVGHAMKAIAPPPGTVLGKALEPLHEGSGIVLVLITLQ